ncbi:MAG TPA: T9SS type A sorting domain-containing protein [Flavobacteriales bacterium]|nr:T9SS type A sorting domain-containing protein [Flavobacteriales bacterium]
MNNLKVTIPNPCHENWDKMIPNNNGRHCESCNKTVVDFTRNSPEEISQYLSTAEGKICGRFKKNHVYQPTVIDASENYIKPSWFRSRWMAMFAVVSFIGFGKKSAGQMVGQVVAHNPDAEQKKSTAKQTPTVIHGWIKNSKTKKGITEVEIRIYSGGREIAYSTSFANGSYFIMIPGSAIYDFKIDLEYNHVSYESKILKDLPIHKDRVKCDANLVSTGVVNNFLPSENGVSCELVDDVMGDVVDVEPPFLEITTMGEPVRMVDAGISESKKTENASTVAPLLHADSLMNVTTTYNVEKIDKNNIHHTINASGTDFKVTAYPNPGPGLFNFKIDNSEKNEIFIFDMEGKLVASKKTSSPFETVDITSQPDGTYVVRIVSMSQNKVKQIKVVKAN